MRLLSQASTDIFGKITPPVPIADDPFIGVGKLLSFLVKFILIMAGLIAGTYLLLGAFDWITSGGEKEKLTKAQQKITNAIIGLLIFFIVLTLFGLITGDILGIIINTPQGWQLKIPTL